MIVSLPKYKLLVLRDNGSFFAQLIPLDLRREALTLFFWEDAPDGYSLRFEEVSPAISSPSLPKKPLGKPMRHDIGA